jgi:hypothetical protein
MDAVTPKRRSRWKKPPIVRDDGSKFAPIITQNDEAIFRLLTNGSAQRRPWGYPALRTNYISALLGRDHTTVRQRLDELAASRYLYLPDQPRNNFRHLIYALDKEGADHIAISRPRHSRWFKHELEQCDIAASFELATKENGRISIIPWPVIYSSDSFPDKTRQSSNPMALPVGDRTIRADWEPFVLKIEGKRRPFFFMPGFEADTGTEPMDATDGERSSIRQKFVDYLDIIDRGTYEQHFGATTFYIPFITMSETRMQHMIELLHQVITSKGYPKEHARRFLFKNIPSHYDKPAPATGHMVTEPWQRAFYEPFSFIEE